MTTTATPPTPPDAIQDIPGVTRRHRFGDFYHETTNFQFIKHSRRWLILSTTMVVVSLLALVFRGPNLGIEFEGGTAWTVEVADGVDPSVQEVRDALEPLGFSDSKVSILSGAGNQEIRVQAEVLEDPVQQIEQALADATGMQLVDVQFDRAGDGGTMTVQLPEGSEVTADDVTAALETAGHPAAEATLGDARVMTVTFVELPPTPLQEVANTLAEYSGRAVEEVNISTVGPTWGERVTRKAIQATLIFFLLLAIYLSFRFEWKMAASAIVAVLHDIVICIGFYAIFHRFEVTPATVTAFLTILGFSLYDTVVVFDKVRENQRTLTASGRSTYPDMVNTSLNAVLMRSLSTSFVALMPVLSLWIIGGQIMGTHTLEEFAVALTVGLLIGSYSSIFVAAPILAWWKNREPQYRALADRQRRTTLAAASASTGLPVVHVDEDIDEVEERPMGVPGPPAVGRTTPPRPRQQRRRKRR